MLNNQMVMVPHMSHMSWFFMGSHSMRFDRQVPQVPKKKFRKAGCDRWARFRMEHPKIFNGGCGGCFPFQETSHIYICIYIYVYTIIYIYIYIQLYIYNYIYMTLGDADQHNYKNMNLNGGIPQLYG